MISSQNKASIFNFGIFSGEKVLHWGCKIPSNFQKRTEKQKKKLMRNSNFYVKSVLKKLILIYGVGNYKKKVLKKHEIFTELY